MYCEPKMLEFGTPKWGWRGCGGLLFNEDGTLCPQHNLAAVWKRPVGPFTTGYREPLRKLTGKDGEKFRESLGIAPTLCLSQDKLRNRNMLAVKTRNKDELRVWSVNSACDGLIQFDAQVPCDNADFRLISDGDVEYTGTFDDPISELRTCDMDGHCLWARGEKSLRLIDDQLGTGELVFKGAVRVFEESPYLTEELCLVDENGEVVVGEVGKPLTTVNRTSEAPVKSISHSDHPRVLLAASDSRVTSFDVRSNGKARPQLFEVADFYRKSERDVVYAPSRPRPRDVIHHIRSIPNRLHSSVVVTGHYIHLLDDRYPGREVLSIDHVIDTCHVLLAGRPVKDPMADGHICSFYLMDYGSGSLWRSQLYSHSSNLWSTICPINTTGRLRADSYVMDSFDRDIWQFRSGRGVALAQNLLDSEGRAVDVVLEAFDDGSITYQPMRYGSLGVGEMRTMCEKSLRRSREWNKEEREETSRALASRTNLVNVNITRSPTARADPFDVRRDAPHPLRRRVAGGTRLPLLKPAHPDALISNGVLALWNQ